MLDSTMFTLSQLFLVPTLGVILGMFIYSFVALGGFVSEFLMRTLNAKKIEKKAGYPILALYAKDKTISIEQLELYALKRLQMLKNVSRIAPMMGLIATLIPLGPALKSLTDGNIEAMSEGLMIAFSGVTLGLIAASITYWISNTKKLWYVDELESIELLKGSK